MVSASPGGEAVGDGHEAVADATVKIRKEKKPHQRLQRSRISSASPFMPFQ
jgi:hypothetical protein